MVFRPILPTGQRALSRLQAPEPSAAMYVNRKMYSAASSPWLSNWKKLAPCLTDKISHRPLAGKDEGVPTSEEEEQQE